MLARHVSIALVGAAMMAAPAFAQMSGSSGTTAPGATAPGAATTAPGAVPTAPMSTTSGSSSMSSAGSANWLTQEQPGTWRASKLDGLNVYNENNESIGEIKEMLLDSSGKVQAVVIGVGGFLGIGEREVAVPFEQVRFVNEPRASAGAANTGTAGTTAGTGTAGTTAAPGTTTGTVRTDGAGTAATDASRRSGPDHALLNMSKDQLKSAPEFKYTR